MVSCLMGDSTALASAIVRCCPKATMHLEHKPGETMQVDWAGQTAALVDTDTGERLDMPTCL